MDADSNVADSRLTTVMARTPSALYWLALGTFAIGTEGFMIAALLVTIGADLRVSLARAGLLVSIFTFAYATSSPVLTTLTARMDRRRLLILSMSLFAMFNLVAAMAHTFLALGGPRASRVRRGSLHAERQRARGSDRTRRTARTCDCHCQRRVDGGDCARCAAGRVHW